ncbi:MAG: hypothetical protein N2044_06530 [Cyclobacteriaceae bacterium]|nr:hypothetical protein [Cyclobacteriaceae bacterium]MCX7637488.1 hypothetical protein [Cyclobacteriaceae bacterium]
MKILKKSILLMAGIVVAFFLSLLILPYSRAQSVPTCWFDYEYGCDPSGFVGCTACDDDGPVIKPKK